MDTDLKTQVERLTRDLNNLTQEFYRNNFSSHQDFSKFSNFKTRLKVPHYGSAPATAQVGELIEVAGILYVASAADTWTKVGLQS